MLFFVADDYSECQTRMENGHSTPSIDEQLSFILQTPADIKGFLNFAVQVGGISVTGCRPDYGSITACELLIINPMASFTIQVY